MAAEGHIIGNHTATHPSLPGLTDNDIRKELQLVHDKYSFQTLDSLM